MTKIEDLINEILPSLPIELAFIFENWPLINGEGEEHYTSILRSILLQVKPLDVIEALWVRNIIDLVWEAQRLQAWRMRVLAQAHLEAAEQLITPVLDVQVLSSGNLSLSAPHAGLPLAMGWVAGNEKGRAAFEKMMQERGLSAADVTARAFQIRLADIERIDRMIANADHRRDTLLREIERKRASLAQKLRIASADIVDVDVSSSPPRTSSEES
ncbi:hypothetical protein [Methylobacterium oxalidis]|uniref:hypothetical protein n=1 Tax=Methylobacterium oxalidis TaxID=944322 RepID=UPI00331570D6